jgi:uncharacterized protein YbjT (DUF2867 family)
MFSIIGITGRVGGGAASHLLGMGKQVRAVVRGEAKGHVWVASSSYPKMILGLGVVAEDGAGFEVGVGDFYLDGVESVWFFCAGAGDGDDVEG